MGVCLRGVMVKAMDCGIIVHEFVLWSHFAQSAGAVEYTDCFSAER